MFLLHFPRHDRDADKRGEYHRDEPRNDERERDDVKDGEAVFSSPTSGKADGHEAVEGPEHAAVGAGEPGESGEHADEEQ